MRLKPLAGIALLALPFTHTWSADYYVSTTGNNSNAGTQAAPWATIAHSVSGTGTASSVGGGDTIRVQPGTYNERIDINVGGALGNPLTLLADGEVISTEPETFGNLDTGALETQGISNLVIDGFQIMKPLGVGILIKDSHNITIQNNYVFESRYCGIYARSGSNWGVGGEAERTNSNITVIGNIIERANWRLKAVQGGVGGLNEALSLAATDGFEVAYNEVVNGTKEGLDVKNGSRNGSIHHNVIHGQGHVTGFIFSSGPALYIDGSRILTENIDMYSNLVYNNFSHGIYLGDEIPGISNTSLPVTPTRNINAYNNIVYRVGIEGAWRAGRGISVGPLNKNYTIPFDMNNINVVNNTVVKAQSEGLYLGAKALPAGSSVTNILFRNNLVRDSDLNQMVIQGTPDVVEIDHNILSGPNSFTYRDGADPANFNIHDNILDTSMSLALFVDEANADFHLAAGSAAIDAGNNVGAPSFDYDGNPRALTSGDPVDIGAYEFGGSGSLNIPIETQSANLAFGATVTGSSTPTGGSFANVTDDNTVTQCNLSSAAPQWYQVDLGTSQTFNRISTVWALTTYGAVLDYSYSNDGSNWTLIKSVPIADAGFENGAGYDELLFTPVTARYIRLDVAGIVTGGDFHLREVFVHDVSGPAFNGLYAGGSSNPPASDLDTIIQAEAFDASSNVSIVAGGSAVLCNQNGWIRFDGIDFGSGGGANSFDAQTSTDGDNRKILVYIDSLGTTIEARIVANNTGGYGTYQLFTDTMSGITGVHDVYLQFKGGDPNQQLDWIRFNSN